MNVKISYWCYAILWLLLIGNVSAQNPSVNLVINRGGSPIICEGTSIQIDAEISNGEPGRTYSYNWRNLTQNQFSNGDGDGSVFVLSGEFLLTQTSTIQVEVFGGTTTLSDTIEITVENAPNPGSQGNLLLCNKDGQTINLFTLLQGNPDTTGTWTDPSGAPFGTGNTANYAVDTGTPGEYRYTVIGNGPCPNAEASVVVTACFNDDFDNDGVPNDVDLDDDNDGILDTDEDSFCSPADLTESRPVVDINFGTGITSTTDPNVLGHTFSPTWPDDGAYTVATSLSIFNSDNFDIWFMATDQNPDPHIDGGLDTNGRYLAINIRDGFVGNAIYELQDIPIIALKDYNFRIDLVGLCDRPAECANEPDLELQLIDQSNGLILASQTSAGLGVANDDIWRSLLLQFSALTDTFLTLRIINNQIGGNNNTGNDVGIDNIRFATLECDFDRDLVPNYLDLDSDNDGIFDVVEAGWGNLDADNDGVIDGAVNANGVPSALPAGLVAINSDSDTNPDYLDIDSDADGIQDNIEAQLTVPYIAPGGTDANQNGVDDSYEGAGAILPVDTDADGIPDYLDTNSDDDCLDDTVEAYDINQDGVSDITVANLDTDRDGMDDAYDTVVLNEPNNTINPTDGGEVASSFPDNHNPGNDVDYREEFTLIDETAMVEGCSGSTIAFDLYDELTDAAIPGGTWTGPSTLGNGERGTFTPGTNTIGTYIYTLPVIASCPARTGTVTVNLGTLPNPGTDGTLEVCRNDTNSYNLIQSLGGTPDSGGAWTDPNGDDFGIDDQGVFDPDDPNSIAGIYTYTVGTAGCQDTATVTVTFAAGADPGEDGVISLCTTDTPINLFDSLMGTPDTGGNWTGPVATANGDQGTIDPATAVSGDYIYTVSTPACPDPATAIVTVSVETTPTLALDVTNCAADRSTYSVSYTTNGNWNITMTPAGAGTIETATSTITGITAGTNIVIIATNAANINCEASLNITAPDCSCPNIVQPIDVTTTDNANVCFGDPNGTLEVQVDPGLTANWYDEDNQSVANGVTTYNPTVSEPGTYRYFVEAFDTAENCASNRIEVIYNIILLEEAEPFVQGKICVDDNGVQVPGTSLPFIDSGLIGTNYTYQWSYEGTPLPGETGSGISATQVGEYSVMYTDDLSGCSDSASVIVESTRAIVPGDLSLSLSNGQFASSNNIIADVDGTGDYEYSLDDGPFQQSNTFRNVSFGEHTVRVVDINGCGDDVATIKVFGFPAFFTPNGDGTNDTWNVKIQGDEELPPMDINIFDRYGKLMKKQRPTDLGWDGTYNGEPMPSTDYWYSVQILDGTGAEYRGHFNLRR